MAVSSKVVEAVHAALVLPDGTRPMMYDDQPRPQILSPIWRPQAASLNGLLVAMARAGWYYWISGGIDPVSGPDVFVRLYRYDMSEKDRIRHVHSSHVDVEEAVYEAVAKALGLEVQDSRRTDEWLGKGDTPEDALARALLAAESQDAAPGTREG